MPIARKKDLYVSKRSHALVSGFANILVFFNKSANNS